MKNKMRRIIRIFTFAAGLIVMILSVFPTVAWSQNLSAVKSPRRERLLNNLNVLIWSEPANPNVTIKLRVHGGAAFDTLGREGTMRLLADALFPDENTRAFVREELGGDLSVAVNYDYLEITGSARASEFLNLLETIKTGVVNPPIDKALTKKVSDARLKINQAETQNYAVVADEAVRRRLLGGFPYARNLNGTPETLAKIDYADLLLARDRFLTADNATLAIIGNVKESYALRASRQLFGAWRKADKKVPTTFAQPNAPDAQFLVVGVPAIDTGEIRFAMRGAARNSADYVAHELASEILQTRWRGNLPAELRETAFVRHEPHYLPGVVIFGASVSGGFPQPYFDQAKTALQKTLNAAVTNDEFGAAKAKFAVNLDAGAKTTETAARFWLDADTFNLKDANVINSLNAATAKNVGDVLQNWQKQIPAAAAVAQSEGNTLK